MVFWLVAFLLFCVLGIALLELIRVDSGYVLISIDGLSVETSFWFAVFCTLMLIFAVVLALYIVKSSVGSILHSSGYLRRRRTFMIEENYRKALLHYLTDNYGEANKLFASLSKKTGLPVVRALATAASLAQSGDYEKAIAGLEKAETDYPQDRVWIVKSKILTALNANKYDYAKKNLAVLKTLVDGDAFVKKVEFQVLAPELQERQAVSDYVLTDNTGRKSADQDARALLAALQAVSSEQALSSEKVNQLWAKASKKQKQEAAFQHAYASALIASDQVQAARSFIEKSLAKTWNDELVDLYTKTDFGDVAAQLKTAEAWQKRYPQEFALNIALGVLAAKNQYWGKAKSHLQIALEQRESPDVLYLLGFIAEKLDDKDTCFEYYKRAASMRR